MNSKNKRVSNLLEIIERYFDAKMNLALKKVEDREEEEFINLAELDSKSRKAISSIREIIK